MIILWRHVQTQQIEPITSEAGIYYDEVGTVSFYPMTRKVVSYLNLQPTRDLWRKVKDHYRQVILYCQQLEGKAWYHYTDCGSFPQYVNTKAQYIVNLKELVMEYLKPEQQSNRRKRGVLDFVGEIYSAIFKKYLQCVLAAKILTVDFFVYSCRKKNLGRFRHVGSDHSPVRQ
jgi:hypothetical protein